MQKIAVVGSVLYASELLVNLFHSFRAVFDKDIARPLSNSEALQVLNQTQQMRKDDDAAYVPTPMVQQTKQYLERFNTVKAITGIEAMQQ